MQHNSQSWTQTNLIKRMWCNQITRLMQHNSQSWQLSTNLPGPIQFSWQRDQWEAELSSAGAQQQLSCQLLQPGAGRFLPQNCVHSITVQILSRCVASAASLCFLFLAAASCDPCHHFCSCFCPWHCVHPRRSGVDLHTFCSSTL